MARSRFVGDTGLTVRMTTVMFLLGALFVALVVGIALVVGAGFGYGLGLLVGLGGIAVAFYQWANSDKVAMRAMRAREVTPPAGRNDRPALCARRHAQAARRGGRHPGPQRLRHRPLP